ncbi:MAG: alpha/beta hydrolase family protein [Prolixibacteraceae bacterium]
MKKSFPLFFLVLFSINVSAQDISGFWNGMLKVPGMELRVNFNLEKTNDGYKATMDSPDQNAFGIPCETVSFENKALTITLPNMAIEYSGKWISADSIEGTFKQAGQSFPMNLSKKVLKTEKKVRPQEPQGPQSYIQEEIKFENSKDKLILAGTLTLPSKEGKFPAVVLISGSGPQDRNEEVFGHKPFLVLADHLTKKGIAVLRFDDRGIGESTGDFKSATSFDFATDVEAAISYLKTRKEIDQKHIGLIGHSEGGLIAPLVATQSNKVNFIVLLAGPGIPGTEILLQQTELISRASGMDETQLQKALKINKEIYDLVLGSENIDSFRDQLIPYLKKMIQSNPDMLAQSGMNEKDFFNAQMNQIATPWMYAFLRYDPAPTLAKVKCPILALNGEKDLQVPAKVDIEAIEKALKSGGNKDVTTHIIPNLNHLFQECEKGIPVEYGQIEQTFSPVALNLISDWILKQGKE